MDGRRGWRVSVCIGLGVIASLLLLEVQAAEANVNMRFNSAVKYGDINAGSDSIVVRRINTLKDVAGGLKRPSATRKTSKAFILTADGFEDLVGDPGVDFSATFALNDRGEVAGGLNTATALRPFRAKRGQNFQLLTLLPGDTGGLAFGINDGGEVAGYSSGKVGERAVWWDIEGNVRELKGLSGLSSRALGLNDKGDVVGVSGSGRLQGLLWPSKGKVIALGTLPGATGSEAASINNRGDIAGFASGIDGVRNTTRAVMWSPDGESIQDIGVLAEGDISRARDINDNGEVVGTSESEHGSRAFIWTAATGMVDVNTLVSLPTIILTDALGINKKGDIVVIGHEKTAAQVQQEVAPNEAAAHQHGDDGHEQPRQVYVLTRAP